MPRRARPSAASQISNRHLKIGRVSGGAGDSLPVYRRMATGAEIAGSKRFRKMSFEPTARRQTKALLDSLADRLVKELTTAAAEDADAAAARARGEAERAAESVLAV